MAGGQQPLLPLASCCLIQTGSSSPHCHSSYTPSTDPWIHHPPPSSTWLRSSFSRRPALQLLLLLTATPSINRPLSHLLLTTPRARRVRVGPQPVDRAEAAVVLHRQCISDLIKRMLVRYHVESIPRVPRVPGREFTTLTVSWGRPAAPSPSRSSSCSYGTAATSGLGRPQPGPGARGWQRAAGPSLEGRTATARPDQVPS